MAWVQWVDNAVVGNAVYEEKGTGDNWRELTVVDQTCTDAQELVIVEEGGWGAQWAAPIASLLMEKYLNGYVLRKDLSEYICKTKINE